MVEGCEGSAADPVRIRRSFFSHLSVDSIGRRERLDGRKARGYAPDGEISPKLTPTMEVRREEAAT
jgi:hypothetical protein